MIKLMGKLEAGLTGLLWLAATLLLPLAALAPIGGARADSGPAIASAACLSIAVDTLRACPFTSL